MKLSSLGIRSKLLAAFGLVLLTTLVASAIALNSYNRLSESFLAITEEHVPQMGESVTLMQLASDIGARIPLIASSSSSEEVNERYRLVSMLLDDSKSIHLSNLNSGETTEQSRQHLDAIEQRLTETSEVKRLTEQRISTALELDSFLVELSTLAVQTNASIMEGLDAATSEFYSMAESMTDANSDKVDDLLVTYLAPMIAAIQIDNAVRDLAKHLNDTAYGRTGKPVDYNRARAAELTGEIAKLRSRLNSNSLPNEQGYKYVSDQLNNMAGEGSWIFRLTDSELDMRKRATLLGQLNELEASMSRILSEPIKNGFEQAVVIGQELDKVVKGDFPTLMNDGVGGVLSMIELRAEISSMTAAIVQAANANSESQVESQRQRFNAALKLAQAARESIAPTTILTQFADQFERIVNIGIQPTNLFDLKLSLLQLENDAEKILKNLLAEQAKTVSALVVNADLSREKVYDYNLSVANLISSSRYQLIAVSSLSVLITVLVFWLLISKHILNRLISTINALKQLAASNNEAVTIPEAGDELSDLAHTVGIFQKNAQQSKELQAEQLRVQEMLAEQEHQKLIAAEKIQEERAEQHRLEQEAARRSQEAAETLQKRVDLLLEAVNAATEGNLSYPIKKEGDDLSGQLGRALSDLLTELKSSMHTIGLSSTNLSAASSQLTEYSVRLNENASSNTETAQNAASLAEDVGVSMDRVTGAATQLDQSIAHIAEKTTEVESVSNEAIQLITSTNDTVSKLSESSNSISSVIKDINTIAEQTNLLALNATIEAARAGDAGKGFAVVANEVKELANETASATHKIESRVHQIQSNTTLAVDAMLSISEFITKINDIQSGVVSAIDDQNSVTKEINDAVMATSHGSKKISSLIGAIAEKAEENKSLSSDISTSANSLSNTATGLQSYVNRYVKNAA